jgi:hypothetical protein
MELSEVDLVMVEVIIMHFKMKLRLIRDGLYDHCAFHGESGLVVCSGLSLDLCRWFRGCHSRVA